jgi:hypothetical protein
VFSFRTQAVDGGKNTLTAQHRGAKILFVGYQQGRYFGCYMPEELKFKLKERAAKAHRSLSQEVIRILTKAVYKKAVPFEEVGKSTSESKST